MRGRRPASGIANGHRTRMRYATRSADPCSCSRTRSEPANAQDGPDQDRHPGQQGDVDEDGGGVMRRSGRPPITSSAAISASPATTRQQQTPYRQHQPPPGLHAFSFGAAPRPDAAPSAPGNLIPLRQGASRSMRTGSRERRGGGGPRLLGDRGESDCRSPPAAAPAGTPTRRASSSTGCPMPELRYRIMAQSPVHSKDTGRRRRSTARSSRGT